MAKKSKEETAEDEIEEAEEAEEGEAENAEEAPESEKEAEGEKEARPRRKRKEKKAVKKRKSRKEKEDPLAHAIRLAVETGKMEFGARMVVKDSLLAKAKLIVLASNAPRMLQEDITHYSKLSGIPVLVFQGTSMELGSICGRPHPISALSVYDAGNSDIIELAKGRK